MTLHNAPPVTYPLGRSRFLGSVLALAWLTTLGLTGLWQLGSPLGDLFPLLSFILLLVSGWTLTQGWLRSPAGRLAWDGQFWRWESENYQGSSVLQAPVVVIDVQFGMLLRLQNQAGASWWLWAEKVRRQTLWQDLRRAVHAHPKDSLASQRLDIDAAAPAEPSLADTLEPSEGVGTPSNPLTSRSRV